MKRSGSVRNVLILDQWLPGRLSAKRLGEERNIIRVEEHTSLALTDKVVENLDFVAIGVAMVQNFDSRCVG